MALAESKTLIQSLKDDLKPGGKLELLELCLKEGTENRFTLNNYTTLVENVNKRFPDVEVLMELELFNPLQGLLWLPKNRSQKNRQVPFLKVRSQLKFLQGANFFEPKQWMIACTTTSFMYKWSGFVCINVNVCIVLLFFISISSSKTKRFRSI